MLRSGLAGGNRTGDPWGFTLSQYKRRSACGSAFARGPSREPHRTRYL